MRDRSANLPDGAAVSTAAYPDSAILTYHSIDDSGSVISTPREVFAAHMRLLAESRYRVAGLPEAIGAQGMVALTFDDGYRNFLTEALPVLSQFGFPATVFAVAGHCGSQSRWDAGKGMPALPLMDWPELREIVAHGITVGAHSVTHPDLTRLPAQELEGELSASRRMIEDACGCAVEQFAYPYGMANAEVKSATARHFRWAAGTDLRYLKEGSDPFFLPRLDAYYLRSPFRFRSFAQGKAKWYLGARRGVRQLRQWALR